MKRRTSVLAAGMLIAVMALSGCGKTAETKPADSGSRKTEAAQAASPETEAKATDTKWPERPLQNVIPFGAGGGTDVWNRALMDAMSGSLGQTIVSSNMTGGSAGSIGVDYVWKAAHDGYTLCGTSETPLTIPTQTGLTQTSKDWEYFIAAGSPGVLCVNASLKDKTMADLAEELKANPQSVSIAGTSGGLWFALAKLFDSYGEVPFKWVAYDGSSAAIKGSVSKEADCVVASAGEVKEYVKSGDLIPIAVMDKESWEFPEFGLVPAVTETVPELEQYLPLNQFLGFMVPADTDPAILEKLQNTFHEAMKTEKILSFAEEQNCIIYDLTGEDARKMASGIESKLCWVLYDMGQTKFSPEDFGIERP